MPIISLHQASLGLSSPNPYILGSPADIRERLLGQRLAYVPYVARNSYVQDRCGHGAQPCDKLRTEEIDEPVHLLEILILNNHSTSTNFVLHYQEKKARTVLHLYSVLPLLPAVHISNFLSYLHFSSLATPSTVAGHAILLQITFRKIF